MSYGLAEKVYNSTPVPFKSLLLSLGGMRNNHLRYGSYYADHYKTLMQNLTKSEEELKAIQREMLGKLLTEVYQYSPFYTVRIDQAGGLQRLLRIKDTNVLLQELPLLDRATLRDNLNTIVNRNPARKTCCTTCTSGTTGGVPMKVEVDEESLQITYAQWERYYRWMGLPEKFRSVRLSGRQIIGFSQRKPPYWVLNRASNQLFMSVYHIHPDNILDYVNELNRFKPDLIDGYPSVIYTMAKIINENNLPLKVRPKAISTTAETLHDFQREEIEKAFQCEVYNQYATSEGAPWIVECTKGNYHLWTDTGVFEFINERPIDAFTKEAELVVTSFRALKTPLIRYRIGDTVRISTKERPCECDSHYPMIDEMLGRDSDMLYTVEKGYITAPGAAYYGLQGIFRSKIIQTSIDRVEMLIVPTKDYNEEIEQRIQRNLREVIGEVNVSIHLVDEIPLNKNGKFKAIENLMSIEERYRL